MTTEWNKIRMLASLAYDSGWHACRRIHSLDLSEGDRVRVDELWLSNKGQRNEMEKHIINELQEVLDTCKEGLDSTVFHDSNQRLRKIASIISNLIER